MTETPASNVDRADIEKLKDLARESDQTCAEHLLSFVEKVPEIVRPAMMDFIGAIQEGPKESGIKPFVFIGIQHLTNKPEMNKSLGKDMRKILDQLPKDPTIIISGEHTLANITRSSLYREKHENQTKLAALGLVLKRTYRPEELKEHWEEALVDFVRLRPKVKSMGVDANEMSSLTVLSIFKPNIITPSSDAHELFLRLTEGRTRYALNRATEFLNNELQPVFIQGIGHARGVQGWADRYQVAVQPIVPLTIEHDSRPYFTE